MGFKVIAVALLGIAFLTGVYLSFTYPKKNEIFPGSVTRTFTLDSGFTLRPATASATILGTISINGDIPNGSTLTVEAKNSASQQFSQFLQNLPAKQQQTFSYTLATNGTRYDIKATLLDSTRKVIGTSPVLTVLAPSLNAQLTISSTINSITPADTPEQPSPTGQTTHTPQPTATPAPILTKATLSGNVSFHGAAPINSRLVILQKQANLPSYAVAVDNLTPVNGAFWNWGSATSSASYTVIAVLKQKQGNGSDNDVATSSPVTVTAPSALIVLVVNSLYTPPAPSGTASVNCLTYNSGPNQNFWNVGVNFPSFTGAQSYWLQVGTTDGGYDMVNTYGSTLTASTIFKNNTTYYARFAYAAIPGVDTVSGQFSNFSATTPLLCGK